jgi:hypothetical protein
MVKNRNVFLVPEWTTLANPRQTLQTLHRQITGSDSHHRRTGQHWGWLGSLACPRTVPSAAKQGLPKPRRDDLCPAIRASGSVSDPCIPSFYAIIPPKKLTQK